jgi:hypothetical protein
MSAQNSSGIFTSISNSARAYLDRLYAIFRLAKLETKLLFKTCRDLGILIFVLLIFAASTWFSFMLVLYMFLLTFNYSSLFAAMVLSFCNLIALTIVFLAILKIKNNLFYPATRQEMGKLNYSPQDTKNHDFAS